MRQFSPNSRAIGFTLIELMVVIVIISIVSAVIVGEMAGTFHDALLRSTSRQLVSVLSLASSRAISQDRMHLVRFDEATRKYAIETKRHGELVPVESVGGSEGKIDAHIAVRILGEGLNDSISFYPDGTAEEREIELRDPEGFGLALRINPVTSRVQIIELEKR
ncbi:MAG TPA: prepilin-type N-terminal cleavage/methylation domain-containing protein [Verrucomicrobiae bacterium]|jgi:prepilin-type N-terminal cleavage/methylation domain-containing protein